jgi:hypothetical protein
MCMKVAHFVSRLGVVGGHSLHKEGKLISEQNPGDSNPLLLLAVDPSHSLN